MSLPNYKYWDIRIDENKYDIRIDSTLSIRIDHAPISGVVTSPSSPTNITTSNQSQTEITTTRAFASQVTS